MRKWLGLTLLITGLAIGLFSFSEWYTAKSSAQALTNTELKTLENIEIADDTESKRLQSMLKKYKNQALSPLLFGQLKLTGNLV